MGTALQKELEGMGGEVVALSREQLDVRDRAAVRAAFQQVQPEVILHCAAFTAVDDAERQEHDAFAVNKAGTLHVTESAREVGAVVVYPSTDFVFDGTSRRPYTPEDVPNPLGAYGRSKLAGEEVLRGVGGEWLIVRLSWLYGAGGRNFVDAIIERARRDGAIQVVTDQIGSPTWSRSAARTILDLLEASARGVFHASDRGETSWFGLAGAALDLARVEATIEPVSADTWAAPAPRPAYSALDVSETEQLLGRDLTHWTDSLAAYLDLDVDRKQKGE